MKPDILTSLMNANLTNLSTSSTNDASLNNNSWHSANPLVTNHQLSMPPTNAIYNSNANQNSNNNNNTYNSLDDLDPFGSNQPVAKLANSISPRNQNPMANTYTLQKPTVDYIYPSGYNGNNLVSINSSATDSSNARNGNFNTLSQQDIMNFLN